MKMNQTVMLSAIAIGILTAATSGVAQTPPSPDQLVAALKQNLAESQKTPSPVRVDRDDGHQPEGRREVAKQQRVYYGADGKLTKVPMGEPKPAARRAEVEEDAAAVAADESRRTSSRTRKTRWWSTWKRLAP